MIDSKSGVTGAGRKASKSLLFGEIYDDFRAYKVLCHQHEPEIQQILNKVSGAGSCAFVPHLLPLDRGILSTIHIQLDSRMSHKELYAIYEDAYKTEAFVHLLPPGQFPGLKAVNRTNQCHVGVALDPTKQTAVVITAIDNLGKGAAGQAVQNMNVMHGFSENEGLN